MKIRHMFKPPPRCAWQRSLTEAWRRDILAATLTDLGPCALIYYPALNGMHLRTNVSYLTPQKKITGFLHEALDTSKSISLAFLKNDIGKGLQAEVPKCHTSSVGRCASMRPKTIGLEIFMSTKSSRTTQKMLPCTRHTSLHTLRVPA